MSAHGENYPALHGARPTPSGDPGWRQGGPDTPAPRAPGRRLAFGLALVGIGVLAGWALAEAFTDTVARAAWVVVSS